MAQLCRGDARTTVFALAQFCLHRDALGALAVQYDGAGVDPRQVRTAWLDVFGQRAQITVEQCTRFGDEVIQYTSALAGALA